jgi:hypothetical protein
MVETTRVLGSLAAVLLIAAVVAWVRLFRGPLRRLDGRTEWDPGQAELASQLLMWAAGLSTAAAMAAISRWIFG